jgi:hypothetical protein
LPSDLRLAGLRMRVAYFTADHRRRYIMPRRAHGRLDKASKSYFSAACRIAIKMPGTPERDAKAGRYRFR